jgi:hypothetical protein
MLLELELETEQIESYQQSWQEMHYQEMKAKKLLQEVLPKYLI